LRNLLCVGLVLTGKMLVFAPVLETVLCMMGAMARVKAHHRPGTVERRRCWIAEQKRAIVAEGRRDAVVTEIARRAEICPGQIYRWRLELRVGKDSPTF
jgi:transposase